MVKTESENFKRILARNVILPLLMTATLSAVFITLIFHLISVRKMVDHSDLVIGRMNVALKEVIDSETGVRGFLLTGKPNFLQPYNEAVARIDRDFSETRALVNDNSIQVARVNEAMERYSAWLKFAREMIAMRLKNGDVEKALASEKGKTMMDNIRSVAAQFITDEENIRNQRSLDAENMVRFAVGIITIFTLLLGGALALFGRAQLLKLAKDYNEALSKQLEQNKILADQEWLQKNLGKLSEETRGEQTLEKLSARVLSFLAEQIQLDTGAFYIAEGGKVLNRKAAYALSAEEIARSASLTLGEGQAGQAALQKEVRELSGLPASYFSISSGLGSAAPAQVFIVPLYADELVQGVIELGFLKAVPDSTREFLKRISDMLGIAIRSAQYRERLQSLLEESQQQAEELQVQQEELRVSNEELEEQSKALRSSQVKLETQQAELEQINSQLEGQSRRLEEQSDALKNQNLDLKQAQERLEVKAHELEISSEYKSQFLANMSHELRTPLNSTLILTQLLIENKDKRLSPVEVEYAQTILSSSNDLLVLINDILDLSKVEAGKIDLEPAKVGLQSLCDSLTRTFSPIANSKKIQFSVTKDADVPESMFTDRQRLEQILKNLLSNALKFTEKGSVSASLSLDREHGNQLRFKVKDSGIGIPVENQEIIFEAFRQADGTTNRKFGGTGLGLTISRNLAKLLGGYIEVTSQVGKGSEFTLVLPQNYTEVAGPEKTEEMLAPGASHSAKPLPAGSAHLNQTRKVDRMENHLPLSFADDREKLKAGDRTLLLVEDDQTFAKIVYELSHELNFKCLVAVTASDGIQLAMDYLPGAIILDMNLPDHSGLTVLDQLKDNARTRHIPVHVISAKDPLPGIMEMGAIGFLSKPASLIDLKSVFEKLESKIAQEHKNVLVVEDNAVQREAIRKLIEDQSVQVMAVETGQAALEELERKAYDCMIIDLSLPDMTGFVLLEKMKESGAARNIPVIIYTGRDITAREEEQLKRYSNSIIIKGVRSPERLMSEVSLFLHQVEAQMPPERQKTLQNFRDREKIFEARNILLVDDDIRNIFALGSALESKGANVIVARNGREAIDALHSNENVELVLMDIMMPEMDGYEAMREIRKEARYQKLPIIAVTAKAMPDDQRKCLDAGANDYLSKPVDLPKLLSLIRVWISQEGKHYS